MTIIYVDPMYRKPVGFTFEPCAPSAFCYDWFETRVELPQLPTAKPPTAFVPIVDLPQAPFNFMPPVDGGCQGLTVSPNFCDPGTPNDVPISGTLSLLLAGIAVLSMLPYLSSRQDGVMQRRRKE